MCYHPKTIKNPILLGSSFHDKPFLTVPCGHCSECRQEKRDSWMIRLYYEFLRIQHQKSTMPNSFVLYLTLTYNRKSLPVLEYDNAIIPCFSKKHIQNYVRNIRKSFKRHYGHAINFKYFISSELGGQTHRPHYHCLFFVDDCGFSSFFITKMFQKAWKFGFTKLGKYNRGIVTNQGAIKYCAKYVAKDTYTDTITSAVIDYINQSIDYKDVEKFYQVSITPFHLQSTGLGIYALQYHSLDEIASGHINIVDSKQIIKSYKLPLYLDRQAHYEVKFNSQGNPYYCLTPYGSEVMASRYIDRHNEYLRRYDIVCSSHFEDSLLDDLNKKFTSQFRSTTSVIKFLMRYNSSELAIYHNIFHNYKLINNLPPEYFQCLEIYSPDACPRSSLEFSRDPQLLYKFRLTRNLYPNPRMLELFKEYETYFLDYKFNIADGILDFLYYHLHLPQEEKIRKQEISYEEQKTSYLQSTNVKPLKYFNQ